MAIQRALQAIVITTSISFGIAQVSHADIGVATQASEFAVFAGGDITLERYTTILGDTYAGGSITDVGALGIQRPARHLGNYYSLMDIVGQGGLSDFNGNVSANGSIEFDTDFGVEVNGNAVYGTSISGNAPDIVTGTIQQIPNSVPVISLPETTNFSVGSENYVEVPGQDVVHLAPGSYRNVSLTSRTNALHLSSGDYFIRRLDTWISTDLHFDTTGGPINVYVLNDVFFETGLNAFINGEAVSETMDIVPDNVAEAANVTFEVHGDFTIDSGFLNSFFGTVFVPFGNAELDSNNFFGSVISGQDISGDFYISHVQSKRLTTVPEPGAVAALLSLPIWLIRRRRRSIRENRARVMQ